jgi:hypothetical protein
LFFFFLRHQDSIAAAIALKPVRCCEFKLHRS